VATPDNGFYVADGGVPDDRSESGVRETSSPGADTHPTTDR